MMKARLAVIFLLFAALGARLAVAQAEDPELRKEIQRFYSEWDRKAEAGDLKALLAMLHPSFTMTDKEGHVSTYSQMKTRMTGLASMMRGFKSKIAVKQVQRQGDEVVAWMDMSVSCMMKQGTKWVPMNMKAKIAETLKQFDGKWKVICSQELP